MADAFHGFVDRSCVEVGEGPQQVVAGGVDRWGASCGHGSDKFPDAIRPTEFQLSLTGVVAQYSCVESPAISPGYQRLVRGPRDGPCLFQFAGSQEDVAVEHGQEAVRLGLCGDIGAFGQGDTSPDRFVDTTSPKECLTERVRSQRDGLR